MVKKKSQLSSGTGKLMIALHLDENADHDMIPAMVRKELSQELVGLGLRIPIRASSYPFPASVSFF